MGNQPNQQPGEKAQGLIEYGREQIAQQFSQVSDLVRDACGRLEPGTAVSKIAGQISDSLTGAGKYISSADPARVAGDAREFAHRRPEVFLGGAFLGGLMLGRFLRSQPPRDEKPADSASPLALDSSPESSLDSSMDTKVDMRMGSATEAHPDHEVD